MKNDKMTFYIFITIMIIPVIWIALLIAPYITEGILNNIPSIIEAFNHPFHITLCENSIRTVLACLCIYGLCILMYVSNEKNYRLKEEHGSAIWGNVFQISKKLENNDYFDNKLFSQNFRLGLDSKKHRRNLHTIVVGGSGAGKTRFYCKPNIMQCNSSFVCLDPKGELLRDVGSLLEEKGYVIKVIDLIDMHKSHGYNPFKYIQDDKDILMLVTNLIRNTTPKNSSTNDPFWDRSETALLTAIFLYLFHEAPEEEQNFGMVLEMIEAADVREDDEDYRSPLDMLFYNLENRKPGTLAYAEYIIFKKAPAKTALSILVSVGVRLAKFYLIKDLTAVDELELEQMGTRKQALFAIIPDNDTTFNFLVGMLYTQLFQMLYYKADRNPKGELEVPVHFVMDEFANVSLPDSFENLLATMRSRLIYVSIIVQNIGQLKTLFKDSWEGIIGLCDTFYYLGGNEQSTHKFVSEYLGKATIDAKSYSKSSGSHGNYSTNYQQLGRELMTPDEVRLLDNNKAILFVKSERPICDYKYDIYKHPNIDSTYDGKGKAYIHGKDTKSIENWVDIVVDDDFEIYSDEDMDIYFRNIEERKKKEELLNETRKAIY